MLLLDHESLPRIKPHLHLYIYNIHDLQIPIKYNSIVFAPRMMYIRNLSRSYKGNSRLLDKQRLFFIHLSLLPANRLEIAGLQLLKCRQRAEKAPCKCRENIGREMHLCVALSIFPIRCSQSLNTSPWSVRSSFTPRRGCSRSLRRSGSSSRRGTSRS